MRRLFVWVLFFAMAGAVWAALGDGADKIEDSYGPPVSRHLNDDETVAIVYHKDRYLYTVLFDHAVSIAEEYSRVDRRNLSDKEIARFLKMNAGRGVTWTRADPTDHVQGRRFERSDRKAEASATGTSLKVRRKN